MAKVVKVMVVDDGGRAVAGVKVSVSGLPNELVTGAEGMTQFLLDDGSFSFTLDGKPAFSGGTDSVTGPLTFKKSGDGFTQQ